MSTQQPLERDVLAAMERDPKVNLHGAAVELESDGVTVCLNGQVGDIVAKRRAALIAAAVPGIVTVVDRLRLAPATSMGDGEVRDHVHDALLQEPAFREYEVHSIDQAGQDRVSREPDNPAGRLTVEVHDGVITLEGSVGSLSHKRLAGVMAWWVPGTVEVFNKLNVTPPAVDNDAELSEVVELVLEKDRLVDGGQIGVSADEFRIRLDGVVPTREQMALAEHDAWYVDGVRDVENRLVLP